jgi:branched-chain amino acid transport system substrate-binding protein
MVSFVEAYKKKYNGKVPDAMAVLGYDAALVLADAMKRAGSTEPAAVRDAIAATKDFSGASGKFSLNADRDAVKALVFIKIEDEKFKYTATVNP